MNSPVGVGDLFFIGIGFRTLFSGYGIGLSAARSICEALGGKLTANYPSQGRIRFTAKF